MNKVTRKLTQKTAAARRRSVRTVAASVPPPPSRDLLIVAYGPQDETDRWLRPALDSIRRYSRNCGKVVVAGAPPAWLPQYVVRFPVPPIIARGSRYDCSTDCVLRAIESKVMEGEFLFMPPGCALSGEADFSAYPHYSRRERIQSVADMIRVNRGGAVVTRYRLVLADTRAALERNGYGAQEFTGRFLTHIDCRDAAEVKRIWLQEPHGEFGYDVSCLFGNVRYRCDPFAVTPAE